MRSVDSTLLINEYAKLCVRQCAIRLQLVIQTLFDCVKIVYCMEQYCMDSILTGWNIWAMRSTRLALTLRKLRRLSSAILTMFTSSVSCCRKLLAGRLFEHYPYRPILS